MKLLKMELSTFIKSSFENDKIDVNSLAKILQFFASKLHLQHRHIDPANFPDDVKTESLNENFDIVNLSKRVEGVEEVTRELLSTFEAVKASNHCLCTKLEETRGFANKIFDEVEALKLKSSVKVEPDDNENQQQQCQEQEQAKFEKLEEIIEQKLSDDNRTTSLAISVLDGKIEKLCENFSQLLSSVDKFSERIEDLTFACEELDGKSAEIDREVQVLKTQIRCMDIEISKIGSHVEAQHGSSEKVKAQLDVIEQEKLTISQADKLMNDKLTEFTTNDNFIRLRDSITDNVTLIDHDLTHTKTQLAKLQNQINAKLNVNELSKFKQNLRINFDNFIIDLENALTRHLTVNREGFAGKLQLACVGCDSAIFMPTKVEESPWMKRISNRFRLKTSRYPVRKYNAAPTSDILDLLQARGRTSNRSFVSKDQSAFKVDPER